MKISDISKEEQTPQLKKELYDMVLTFVRKYQPLYYAQYKGDIRDLASDFYVEFLTEKGRGNKPKESLLDKYDPNITVLPYLVKVAVQRALIDRSRSDKGEINYLENYDDEDDANRLTLNILSKNLEADDPEALENIEFSDEFIDEMKERFLNLSIEEQNRFRKALEYYRKKYSLLENFDQLFSNLEEFWKPEEFKGELVVSGKQPNFVVTFKPTGGEPETFDLKSRNMESVTKKLGKMFPNVPVSTEVSDSVDFSYDKEILNEALTRGFEELKTKNKSWVYLVPVDESNILKVVFTKIGETCKIKFTDDDEAVLATFEVPILDYEDNLEEVYDWYDSYLHSFETVEEVADALYSKDVLYMILNRSVKDSFQLNMDLIESKLKEGIEVSKKEGSFKDIYISGDPSVLIVEFKFTTETEDETDVILEIYQGSNFYTKDFTVSHDEPDFGKDIEKIKTYISSLI